MQVNYMFFKSLVGLHLTISALLLSSSNPTIVAQLPKRELSQLSCLVSLLLLSNHNPPLPFVSKSVALNILVASIKMCPHSSHPLITSWF